MSGSGKTWRWYWVPRTVFFIGIFSIVLLLWVERVNEKLRIDYDIVDAIMDVQIHTATAHLWLEHAIGGDTEAHSEKVIAEIDQAIKLIDVTLKGGKAEHDWIAEPLRDPQLRVRAETIKSLLSSFKMLGQVRLQNPEKSKIGSVLHRKSDAVFEEISEKTRDLEYIIETDEAINEEKSKVLFWGILVIWTLIVVAATTGLWHREKERKKAEEELMAANEQLLSQTDELRGHREHLENLVERRAADLMTTNELLRVEIAERRQTEEALRETEKQIRHLSSSLINAQEVERRRISMELHDELGQALNVTKLRIRVMEKGLKEDQPEIKEECEDLLEYMNNVIEDVRRLSLDLSPTVLEDLGLTSALRWLISNLSKMPNLRTTSDIVEVDHLFPRGHWITIYRVVQEALTNIRKHAQAENVSVVIRHHDNRAIFSIEDDGQGFDPEQISMKDAPAKGLGLATMSERMKMVGGILDLRSRKGKGTRITFSLPVEEGAI